MEGLAPLARTKKDFMGSPPEIPDNTPHIDTFSDDDLSNYFLERCFIQAQIGLSGEGFLSTTPENLQGIRNRTIAALKLDIEYAQSRGRKVPVKVLDYLKNL